MSRLLKLPKVQMALALTAVFLAALFIIKLLSFYQGVVLVFTCLFFTITSDLLFTYLKSRTFFKPFAAIVSGLIIALIIDPSALWYQIAFISILAIVSKNFLRFSGRHIFNPAAFGILSGQLVFGLSASWWGASFPSVAAHPNIVSFFSLAILLLPAYVSGFRMKRYYIILTFLIFFTIFTSLGSPISLKTILDKMVNPGVIFFTVIMLVEPMTSPVGVKKQVLYAILAALLVKLLSLFTPGNILITRLVQDAFIFGLLAANALFFRFRF